MSHDAMFALGVVLTIVSLAALGLYRLKPGLDWQQTKSSLVELGQSPPHQIISAWAGLWLDIP